MYKKKLLILRLWRISTKQRSNVYFPVVSVDIFLNNILVKQSWIILKRGLGRVLVKYREIKRITVPSNILRDLVRSPYACNHKIY